MTILAVTGLTREAQIIGGPGVVAVAGGGDAKGLAEKLDALHGDIIGVISIGLGGALSPLLKVGDVIIADKIVGPLESHNCDSLWMSTLVARISGATVAHIAGSSTIIADKASKWALYSDSGAAVVDMESLVAARFAGSRNLKFAALRVISDDANHTLPPAALVAMKPDGGIAIGRVLGSLLRHPFQVPQLIRTARASNKAFAELLRCRDLCGVGLAGLDV